MDAVREKGNGSFMVLQSLMVVRCTRIEWEVVV